MFEVRRDDDGELCGDVVEEEEAWRSTTVFGGVLGTHESRDDAVGHVLALGLSALAERWQLRRTDEVDAEVVCIQEADPTGVTLALGHSSMPGVPTLRVTRSQLDSVSEAGHRGLSA